MNPEPDRTTRQLLFLEDLIAQNAHVAGDVIPIDSRTWAIHGTILVDGEVLMAEFEQLDEARAALAQLRPDLPPT